MQIDLPTFLAFINIIFGAFLCFLVFQLTRKEEFLKDKFSKSEEHSREILENAHMQAVKIMENSEKLINTINTTYKKASEDLLLDLQKNNEEIYKRLFEKVLNENENFYKKALVDLKSISTQKIKEDSDFFKKHFEEFDGFIKGKRIESLKEIENYKSIKIQNFESEFSNLIKEALTKIIPQTINTKQDEELIYSAVENAKTSGFFNSL